MFELVLIVGAALAVGGGVGAYIATTASRNQADPPHQTKPANQLELLRQRAETFEAEMRLEEARENTDPDELVLAHVLEYANQRRIIDLNGVFSIATAIRVMRAASPFSNKAGIKLAKRVVAHIDRRVVEDIAAEHETLDQYLRQRDAWLASMDDFIDVLLPLFPALHQDEKPGQTVEMEEALLDGASDPLNTIRAAGFALAGKPGTGVTTADIPDKLTGSPADTVRKHYDSSLLPQLFAVNVDRHVHIPFATRFEHSHVLGGTGHGKTQFLQSLILRDLEAAQEGKGSVVVIDGQGDLIRKIARSSLFDPDVENSLADKLVLIDAADVEFPVCLNMFDMNLERLETYQPADRERILNATISLYEYFFGALLGSGLTQKQGVIFKYLARLMFAIPDATVETLLDVMENGDAYRPYMDQLDPLSQRFYATQFFSKSFDETKEQIARRLWGILSNGSLARMFTNTHNKIDMFDAINSGKIILINTAKDITQSDGSAILGRFFIALLVQAAVQRSVIPENKRRATFAYIDEIQDYIAGDNKIEELLNQARKYKVGLLCAHQNLDQLSPQQRATFMASTSTKYVGGLSGKDARALASDMRTNEAFLLSAQKEAKQTNFAFFVKNVTQKSYLYPVLFGQLEERGTMSDIAFSKLLDHNRDLYCIQPETIAPTVVSKAPVSAPRSNEEEDLL